MVATCLATNGSTQSWSVPWLDEYPRCNLLSTGEILFSGYAPRAAALDPEVPGIWVQAQDQPGQPGVFSSNWQQTRHDGSAVLFPNLGGNSDIVLRLGGATDFTGQTTDTMESIAGGAGGTWTSAPSLPANGLPDGGRAFANVVILPTGGLLILGGKWQDASGAGQPVYFPVVFEGGQWAKMPPNPVASRRTYHSTAVLLPDGRVFLGGGNDRDFDYEIFSPPYLNVPANRPTRLLWEGTVPLLDPSLNADVLNYGGRYEITCDPLPLGQTITKAVLMAPCSVTHHSDMHQRYVEMVTDVQGGNHAVFYTPVAETEAPRGIYMLFLVSNESVSEAMWVVLR